MKNLLLGFIVYFITTGKAHACAMCMGSNPNDKYYLYVIGAFILVIYFPMFYLFKTFYKYKNINNQKESDLIK